MPLGTQEKSVSVANEKYVKFYQCSCSDLPLQFQFDFEPPNIKVGQTGPGPMGRAGTYIVNSKRDGYKFQKKRAHGPNLFHCSL